MNTILNSNDMPTGKTADYLEATRKGFTFANIKKAYDRIQAKKARVLEAMGENEIPPYKTVLSFGAVGVSIVLGAINAGNIKQSIGALGFGNTLALATGAAFTCIGLLIGERMSDGLEVDEFTQKKRPTGRFWGAACLGLLYLGTQVFLSKSAGQGGDVRMQSVIDFTFFFSLFVALIELATGFLFLKNSLQTISVLIYNIRLWMSRRKLKCLASQTETLWQRYSFTVNKAGLQPADETTAVKQAREYYSNGGFEDSNTINDLNFE